MTQDPGAAAPGIELDALLLGAKLAVPEPRQGAVSRALLVARARGSDCRVVGITAPAGYGKSTLLAQWAQTETRRVAWVSLDRFDDDPATLVWLAGLRVQSRVAGHGGPRGRDRGGRRLRAGPRRAAPGVSVRRPAPSPSCSCSTTSTRCGRPRATTRLSVVISGFPGGSQLAAASRNEQPHLPRLRADGETLELVTSDLALDAAGAEHIFANAQVAAHRGAGRGGDRCAPRAGRSACTSRP